MHALRVGTSRLAVAGRLLLVLAFLVAQQAAISHQIWHAAAAPSHHAAQAVDQYHYNNSRSPNDQLCAFHSAMGAVLGAITTAVVPDFFAELPRSEDFRAVVASASQPSPRPASRGPPSLLPQ
jgi:hypothetical protein